MVGLSKGLVCGGEGFVFCVGCGFDVGVLVSVGVGVGIGLYGGGGVLVMVCGGIVVVCNCWI